MRDRLEEMQQRAQEFSEAASDNTISGESDDYNFVVLGIITPEAVLFEEEPIIESILSEAQLIEDDITVLETEVMRQYNEGLLSKQERCRHFIIRQLEVSGRDVTEEDVDEMVVTGKWEVFNENLLNDVKITRSQLSEIEQRHKEMLSLENNMKELRDLFMDIFILVEEQGAYIEHIQTNIERTQDFVAASNEKFKMAARYKKKNPIRQLCCCCCPPWRCCL